MLLSDFEQS